MKIYMVIADNGESYEDHANWNVGAFASEEAAQAYVRNMPGMIAEANRRFYELDDLIYEYGLDDLRLRSERTELLRKWGNYIGFNDFCKGYFVIHEYEVQE